MKSKGNRTSKRMTPATIWDVAHAAGVSVSTVSKALNGRGQLRDETRERVRSSAGRLGFRPNHLAQSLLRKRSFTVGLISTDSYGRFSIPVLEGIENALEAAQISVFLCNATDNPEREKLHIESLIAKRVDGIIVTGRRADRRRPLDLAGASLPVIYAFAQVSDPKALCLIPDDFGGARMGCEHLIARGRRHIAHVTGPESFEAVRQRRKGYTRALSEQGWACPSERVLVGSWSEAWGHDAAIRLLGLRHPVDAIFCGSDQIARGVVDALRDRGVRVPDDVAVVGFDNWEIIAAATRPPLTTIDMNLSELGRQAGLRLLAAIDGQRESGIVHQPCSLVVRESCGTSHADRSAIAVERAGRP
ncbi:MAG: LacI family DNA-binding transcriptional regulator [Proteobacteria bacterium]|nr:LacI family DNA-binding transcriptional regulator [Pseudomonadota bacterium]